MRFKRKGEASIVYRNGELAEKVTLLIKRDWVQVKPADGEDGLMATVPSSEVVEIIWL